MTKTKKKPVKRAATKTRYNKELEEVLSYLTNSFMNEPGYRDYAYDICQLERKRKEIDEEIEKYRKKQEEHIKRKKAATAIVKKILQMYPEGSELLSLMKSRGN